ncbi:MAG: FAD-dependent oxidoreductase [Rhodospirillaceae bacterium]|nr:FAD-dependent oxidoreductase [Rhodospirillaceae bacterium]
MRYDVVIIGGGIIGSSIAYHLLNGGKTANIAVLERDNTYEKAATPRGSGGIRQLFSLPENIEMGKYGLHFYRSFDEKMSINAKPASISFRKQGYLFVSDGGKAKTMEANFCKQKKLGVEAELLDKSQLNSLFPSVYNKDVSLAVYSPHDAWIDAYAALQGFRKKSSDLGAHFLQEDVRSAILSGGSITKLICASGKTIQSDTFVLAAGAWSKEIGTFLNLTLPIEPMSRETHFFRCKDDLEPLPFIKTETDLAFRPEGNGYTGGIPNWNVEAGWNWELSPSCFQNSVWPALAHRVPAMKTLRLERSWRGHYARNTLDYNAIIGRWITEPKNLIIATGFSGHGIMHAPATGRAVSELLLNGRFQTINLERFGTERLIHNTPYKELGII